MPYHAAAVGWAIEGAGGDERVVIARPGVPEDPRVAPHLFEPQRTRGALAVVARVCLDERVGRVFSPTREVGRSRRAHALDGEPLLAPHPSVEHVPGPAAADYAPGPDGALVPGSPRAGAQGVREDPPVLEVLRD